MQYCLGKLPAQDDPRRVMLSLYSNPTLAPPPAECDRTFGYDGWGVLGNDRAGCCAYAAIAHLAIAWSLGTTQKPLPITEERVIDAYATGTGYNPRTGANDRGSSMLNVLEEWRVRGFNGNKIVAYAGADMRDPQATRESVYYYGGAYCGVQLPSTAIQQTEAGLTWTVPWFASNLGGHAITILSYTLTHLWCITWGKIQAMTWEFYTKYADESFAVLNPLWIAADGLSPTRVNLERLTADIQAVNSRSLAPPVAVA